MKTIIFKRMMLGAFLGLLLTGCGAANEKDLLSESQREKEGGVSDQMSSQETISDGIALGGTSSDEDGLMLALNACVKVEIPGVWGSGVIYEERENSLWIVTAAHVVESAKTATEIEVVFNDEMRGKCMNYLMVPQADLAFLQISKDTLPKEFSGYMIVQKNREIFDKIESGEGVFLEDKYGENEFGFRFATVVENWIYVEDFEQHMLLLSGEADAGMSGSGVFTTDGCFLGIICGGNENGELAVLPYSVIETNLSKVYQ